MILTQQQIIRIRILHEIMGSKWSKNFAKTLNNFNLDALPARELQSAERAVATFLVVKNVRHMAENHVDESWSLILDLYLGNKQINREKLKLLKESDANYIESVYFSDFSK